MRPNAFPKLILAGLGWLAGISPVDKLAPSLAQGRPGSWAVELDGRVRLCVIYFDDVDPTTL